MAQNDTTNRQLVLAQRPKGEPTKATLDLVVSKIPVAGENQMLLRTEFLSLDPYMRGRMSDAPSYTDQVDIGGVMIGGTVAQVVTSNIAGFQHGDWVLSFNGWQDFALSDGVGVTKLDQSSDQLSWALGVLGMPGFTAWAGLTQIGAPNPGETIVVAAATGPVGATVGQIGKLLGCRVVGIAGGYDKSAYGVDELGFNACINHKAPDFKEQLAQVSPNGIDVYFENVGGEVLDTVIPLLNPKARVQVCGLVSQYNVTKLPDGPDRINWLMGQILRKKIKVQGFIVFEDFSHLYPDFLMEMGGWISSGKIKYREEIIDGLENASIAFTSLLKGENFGKCVIRVGQQTKETK
jgi:NADPH-dependent curcumin reductase CurA